MMNPTMIYSSVSEDEKLENGDVFGSNYVEVR